MISENIQRKCVFSKISTIISTMSSKTKHVDKDEPFNERISSEKTKRFSNVDMVFGIGILVIIGVGIFMVFGNNSKPSNAKENIKIPTDNSTITNTKKIQAKKPWEYNENRTFKNEEKIKKETHDVIESKAPFADYVKPQIYSQKLRTDVSTQELEAPPEEYEKKYADQAVTESNNTKETLEEEIKTSSKAIEKTDKKIKPAFVCTLVGDYQYMQGKEIVYYYKKKVANKWVYIPSYKIATWDESGVIVEDKFMAIEVDISHRMVEVSKAKWIPALAFASCILVEESK